MPALWPWSMTPYKRISVLQGHRDAILSVSFSPDAKFIVTCGCDFVAIYDLATYDPVAVPDIPSRTIQAKHTFQASCWLLFEKDDRHVVVLGSLRGDILLWEWNGEDARFNPFCSYSHPEGEVESPVLSMDAHAPTVQQGFVGRIAVATANLDVAVWSVWPSSSDLTQLFRIKLPGGSIPKTVKFLRSTGDVLVFCSIGGTTLLLHNSSGVILSSEIGPYIMGSVCLDEESDRLVAWSGKNTYEVIKYSNMEYIRTLDAGPSLVSYTKHASFIEHGKYVVLGTDRGYAVVFEPTLGKQIQTLDYPRGGLVQHVATSDQPDRYLLAIAGSTHQLPADVVIFQRKSPNRKLKRVNHSKDDVYTLSLSKFVVWAMVPALSMCLLLYLAREELHALRSETIHILAQSIADEEGKISATTVFVPKGEQVEGEFVDTPIGTAYIAESNDDIEKATLLEESASGNRPWWWSWQA